MDSEYAAGITINVSRVDEIIPPIIATAIGPFSSDPGPTPSAAGMSAKINVNEVIKTGLSLTGHASVRAWSIFKPFCRN